MRQSDRNIPTPYRGARLRPVRARRPTASFVVPQHPPWTERNGSTLTLLRALRLMWWQWLQARLCTALRCAALHCTALRWQVDGNAERPLKFSQVSVPHCAKQRGMRLLKADVCVLSQVFQLCPFPNNAGYWVLNDMFRLNIG